MEQMPSSQPFACLMPLRHSLKSIPQPPATAPAVLAPAVTAPAATVAAQPQLGWSDTQALAYIASYGDLMNIIGPSAAGGAEHYITHGKGEGRATTFDPVAYLAANPDVAAYHTGDAASVTMHYIQYGRFENRLLAPAPVAVALPALPDPPSAPVTAAPPPAPEPSPGMLPQPEIILPTIPWHPAAPTIPEMNIPEHAAAPVVPATPSVTHDLCEFVRLEKEKAYEEYVARIIAQQAVTLHEIQLGVNATLALRYDPARVLQEYLQNNRPDNRT